MDNIVMGNIITMQHVIKIPIMFKCWRSLERAFLEVDLFDPLSMTSLLQTKGDSVTKCFYLSALIKTVYHILNYKVHV